MFEVLCHDLLDEHEAPELEPERQLQETEVSIAESWNIPAAALLP
jgi:hypothetical protein